MEQSFLNYRWQFSYRTSALNSDGQPTDILKDFYLPALRRAVSYDRMAGYFRSSSLAAASQGYTAFCRQGGHMRLIVGADLDLQDVKAILAGDEARLEHDLLQELDQPENWESAVQDGVALLGKMVSSGVLEVRVAFRKHGITGKPLAYEDVSDGYVHEKWFLLGDADGNKMYGCGSLNESKTALQINAENLDINFSWEGGSDPKRVAKATADFEKLWNNQTPHMEILTLPDAVRERLISIGQIVPAPKEIDGSIDVSSLKPSAMEYLRFCVLKDAPLMPGGEYLGMYTAPVEPWPHQEIVIHRLVETWPYSYLLCDEVGLGKTIEAALAIRSLVLNGRVKRVLIAAPASLTEQWHRELAQKALLPFAKTVASPKILHEYQNDLYPAEADNNLYSPDLNVISTGLLARKERVPALEDTQPYDIALVDEAHYARRKDPKGGTTKSPEYGQLYTVIANTLRAKAKSLWLATATPMQIDPIEVYDLLRLTHRVASYQEDPTLTMSYFNIMGKLVSGAKLRGDEWRLLGRSFEMIEASDPFLWEFLQNTCVDGKNRKILQGLSMLTREPKSADRKYLLRPMFAASPLTRVMQRHTRQLLEVYRQNGELHSNLARRHILPISAVAFTPKEKVFYDQLEDYCNELTRQIRQSNPTSRQMMFFLLNFLQLRFASSLYAIQQTLKRRLVRVQKTLLVNGQSFENEEELQSYMDTLKENDSIGVDELDMDIKLESLLKDRSMADLQWEESKLEQMLAQLDTITETPSKIQELLGVLERRRLPGSERIQQTVLFTRFLDSLLSIRQYLRVRNPQMRVGIYSGQIARYFDAQKNDDVTVDHEEIKRLFTSGEIDLLLCTDAAAEGLNLQTADLLINFDLGWNPMKIEQRIGRIDRIGQTHQDIAVLNMCYLGSAEETVYGRLLTRLQQANLVVGVQQISMLPIEPDEFRELSNGTLSEENLMQHAEEKLRAQKKVNASMEMSADEQYSMYHHMSDDMRSVALPASLDDVWHTLTTSAYLHGLGGLLTSDGTWQLASNDYTERINGTIDRSALNSQSKPDFLSWGNAKLDRLLEGIQSAFEDEYVSHIRRITASVDGHGTTVGYVVTTHSGAKIVRCMRDLDDADIAEDVTLSKEDIVQAQRQLMEILLREGASANAWEISEKVNAEMAHCEEQLITSAAKQLLRTAIQKGYTKYWQSCGEIFGEDMPSLLELAPSDLDGVESQLIFPNYTAAGRISLPMNEMLAECVTDRAMRAADGLRKKKAEVRIDDVIRRL